MSRIFDSNNSVGLKIFFLVYSIIILSLSYQVAPIHDYGGYFKHWDVILAGGDPWQKMPAANAYGPIYNLFAWLYALDVQLPKLVFVGSWLIVAIYSFNQFYSNPIANLKLKVMYFFFWFLNPFFIVGTVMYGFNDNLVALLVFIGLLLLMNYRKKILGLTFVVLAILTKLYPLFLLPYWSKERNQLIKYLFIALVMIVVSYVLTYLIWGGSFVNAFGKANGRDPTLFSIMRFVDGQYFPLKMLSPIIIGLTNLFVLLGIFYVYKSFINNKIEQHTALLAGFTVLFLFYKAGQQQFFITYFSVFAVWVIIEFKKMTPNLKVFYSVLTLGVWFAIMAGVVYPLTDQMRGDYAFLRDIIGLPSFIIELGILFYLLKEKKNEQA